MSPRHVRLSATAAFLLVLIGTSNAEQISVVVNGQPVRFGANGPISSGGRVLVPLRGVLQSIGASVKYNAAKRRISATNGQINVILGLGDRLATVNNEEYILDVPAKIVNGTAMVPLRFIGESFGAKVEWNETANKIEISTTDATSNASS